MGEGGLLTKRVGGRSNQATEILIHRLIVFMCCYRRAAGILVATAADGRRGVDHPVARFQGTGGSIEAGLQRAIATGTSLCPCHSGTSLLFSTAPRNFSRGPANLLLINP